MKVLIFTAAIGFLALSACAPSADKTTTKAVDKYPEARKPALKVSHSRVNCTMSEILETKEADGEIYFVHQKATRNGVRKRSQFENQVKKIESDYETSTQYCMSTSLTCTGQWKTRRQNSKTTTLSRDLDLGQGKYKTESELSSTRTILASDFSGDQGKLNQPKSYVKTMSSVEKLEGDDVVTLQETDGDEVINYDGALVSRFSRNGANTVSTTKLTRPVTYKSGMDILTLHQSQEDCTAEPISVP